MRSLLALSVACLLASGGTVAAAKNVPGSRFTTIEVSVTDKAKAVPGLTQADFQVFLDGKQQQIESFRAVQQAAEPTTTPTAGARSGKTVMILFDTHAMTNSEAQIAQTAAEKYVKTHLRPQDLFAVAVYGRNLQIIQGFTGDPEKIMPAIRRPLTAFGVTKLEKGFSGAEGLQLGKNALLSLRSLCEDLSQIRGTKNVLVFSQDFFAPSGDQYSRLVESARQAKVSFYTLITTQASAEARPGERRGVRAEGGQAFSGSTDDALSGLVVSSFAPQQQQQQGGPPASTPTGPTGSGISDPSLREDVTKADQTAINSDVLQALAKETNGDYVRESNDLTKALNEFDAVLSNYYVLGLVPSSAADRCKVEVKTSRKGVRLSYSKVLYPSRSGPIDAVVARKLSSTLEAGAATGSGAVEAKTVMLKLEEDLAEVSIYLALKGESEVTAVAALALGEDGTPVGYFQSAKKESERGVGPVSFALRPGRYRVKLAAANSQGAVSVAEHPVTVPHFAANQWVAGDLLVGDQINPLPDLIRGVPSWLIEGHPLVFKGYEITPSVDNRSSREKPLPLFFHLFNAGDTPAASELVSDPRLTDENGQTFLLSPVRHTKTADLGADGTMALGFSIPVSSLKPGKYRLMIQTRGAASQSPVVCETDVYLQ